ncbi:hypothetical protein M011DRAFT_241217 [Sporormia fimetaria CBS 119925]|uniref:Mid2 domain-containing protein n=1 Tax=Sporormia fimetaria CBS 119925 TaxID=1340428 RepID=A0A6A6VMK2_9PLEO|nr:hypothetical protein M011DRAFT_241217 [Sporormia fimetaria CBS 119925]
MTFQTLILLIFLSANAPVFAELTEQRCYYDVNKLAPPDIIPCYQGANQAAACCKKGSKCMQDSTCYDGDTGITYQYGCTDKNYREQVCPRKCVLGRTKTNWVGLVNCNGWFCNHPATCGSHCPDHDSWNPLLENLPELTCDDLEDKYMAFNGPSPLKDYMFLPSDDDDVQNYLDANPTSETKQESTVPGSTAVATTSTPAVTEIATPAVAQTSSGTTDSSPSTAQPSSPGDVESISTQKPLSTGTPQAAPSTGGKPNGKIIGIGAGIALGLVLLGLLIFVMWKRRSKRISPGPEGSAPELDGRECHYSETYTEKTEPRYELPSPQPATSPVSDVTYQRSSVRSPVSPMSSTVGSPAWTMQNRPVSELDAVRYRDAPNRGTSYPSSTVYEMAG